MYAPFQKLFIIFTYSLFHPISPCQDWEKQIHKYYFEELINSTFANNGDIISVGNSGDREGDLRYFLLIRTTSKIQKQ